MCIWYGRQDARIAQAAHERAGQLHPGPQTTKLCRCQQCNPRSKLRGLLTWNAINGPAVCLSNARSTTLQPRHLALSDGKQLPGKMMSPFVANYHQTDSRHDRPEDTAAQRAPDTIADLQMYNPRMVCRFRHQLHIGSAASAPHQDVDWQH